MSDEKEKWMEEVFQSMSGGQRAKPRLELFSKIENQITFSKAKIVSLRQWKLAAAAAAFILLINTATLIYYNQSNQMNEEEVAVVDTYEESIINFYQIYE
ncbi:MAG: hypothetical protein AAGG68_05980 [Bacteroidota bacterium]